MFLLPFFAQKVIFLYKDKLEKNKDVNSCLRGVGAEKLLRVNCQTRRDRQRSN